MKIVADAHIPYLSGVLEPFAEVVYLKGDAIAPADVRDADALLVRTRTRCNRSLLEGSAVRFIASATIGYDHIDVEYCRSKGITWVNAPGCNSSSVQQYMAAALFHCVERFCFGLEGTAIGIVGVGNVGRKVESICRLLGMRVLLNDPPRQRREGPGNFVTLEHVVRESDIITFHVPLIADGEDATHHLADERLIGLMRPEQILINTSRGAVVSGTALAGALKSGRIRAAVLDVWEGEPHPAPDLLSRVEIGTPHIAGYSADGKANGTAMSVNALARFFGLPLDSWYPAGVPLPPDRLISIDCRGKHREEVLGTLVRSTYSIMQDHDRLHSSPETFEQQRAAYPLRREFPAYRAKLQNAGHDVVTAVEGFGFSVA